MLAILLVGAAIGFLYAGLGGAAYGIVVAFVLTFLLFLAAGD